MQGKRVQESVSTLARPAETLTAIGSRVELNVPARASQERKLAWSVDGDLDGTRKSTESDQESGAAERSTKPSSAPWLLHLRGSRGPLEASGRTQFLKVLLLPT